jgi:hypothetical protein
MPNLLNEYIRAVPFKRRWHLMSLPWIIVGIFQFIDVSTTHLPSDIRRAAQSLKSSPWMWVSAFIGSLAIAHWWAWYDEHKRRQQEHDEAQKTIANLEDHHRIESESKVRDWDLERRTFTDKIINLENTLNEIKAKSGTPEVMLEYVPAAQLSSFQLYNAGYADASEIQILAMSIGDAWVSWDFVQWVRARSYARVGVSLDSKEGTKYATTSLAILMSGEANAENPVIKLPLLLKYKGRTGAWESVGEIQYDNRTGALSVMHGCVREATVPPKFDVPP